MSSRREEVVAEPEALALIARAAEGSARDGLSILDQAIAHAGMDAGGVTAAQVREMLGLSDRGAVRRLFALLLKRVTRPRCWPRSPSSMRWASSPPRCCAACWRRCTASRAPRRAACPIPRNPPRSAKRYADWADKLGHATLHRLWQLLLKGLSEIETSAMPMEAAEMGLLRVVHASQLPDPGELLRRLQSGEALPACGGRGVHRPRRAFPVRQPAPSPAAPLRFRVPQSFARADRGDRASPRTSRAATCTTMPASSAMRRPSW